MRLWNKIKRCIFWGKKAWGLLLTRHRLGYFRTHNRLGGGGGSDRPLLSREPMVVSSPARRRPKALYEFFPKHSKKVTLCVPGLTWPFSVVDLHGFRLQNGFVFLILRAKVTINHVLHARKRIFDSGDLPWPSWPDLDPDPYLVWHLCSQGVFTGPLRLLWLSFEQTLSILPALGLVLQKRQNVTFDWPWHET